MCVLCNQSAIGSKKLLADVYEAHPILFDADETPCVFCACRCGCHCACHCGCHCACHCGCRKEFHVGASRSSLSISAMSDGPEGNFGNKCDSGLNLQSMFQSTSQIDFVQSSSQADFIQSSSQADFVQSASQADFVQSASQADFVQRASQADCV